MNPLFPYYGSKKKLASRIAPLLPPHTVYVEPFTGSAAMLFAEGRPIVTNCHDYREVINDQNGHIINLFRVMQDPASAAVLIERLRWTLYSRSEYIRARELLLGHLPGDHDRIERAWACFVVLFQGFGAQLARGGWSYSMFGRNMTSRWCERSGHEHLEEVTERLRHVMIEQEDALSCIRRWDTPQTCFYLDPPYPGTNQGHYQGYTQAQFEELVGLISQIEGSALLSCYENATVPPEWERFEFDMAMTAGNKRGGKPCGRRLEVVWRKPARAAMRPELERVLGYQRQQKLFADI